MKNIKNPVLIVDDDADICDLLQGVAQDVGFETKVLQDPEHFEAFYKKYNPSLIILDLKLGKIDGIDLLHILASEKSKTPIILISGYDEKILRIAVEIGKTHGLKIIADLKKPFKVASFQELLNQTREYVTHPTSQAMETAIEKDQLVLHYQPKIDLKTLKFSGVEALVRWHPPFQPLFMPDDFIPLAEDKNLIKPLTLWVIERALKEYYEWRIENIPLQLALNLSMKVFDHPNFAEELIEMFEKSEIERERVCLEITESAFAKRSDHVLDVLTRFRLKDFRVSIDDFGTGYSSLVELHRIPFNELKIDKSFVREIDTNPESFLIIRSIINLGHELGLKIVAEGIESIEILKKLQELGCDEGQGYFIGKPMSLQALISWQKNRLDSKYNLKLRGGSDGL